MALPKAFLLRLRYAGASHYCRCSFSLLPQRPKRSHPHSNRFPRLPGSNLSRSKTSQNFDFLSLKSGAIRFDLQARRALRALRGLVKLQALVRGQNVRRQATMTLRCMQALVRVQTRVRDQRLRLISLESSNSSFISEARFPPELSVSDRRSMVPLTLSHSLTLSLSLTFFILNV